MHLELPEPDVSDGSNGVRDGSEDPSPLEDGSSHHLKAKSIRFHMSQTSSIGSNVSLQGTPVLPQNVVEEDVLVAEVLDVQNAPVRGTVSFKFANYYTKPVAIRRVLGEIVEFVLPHGERRRSIRFAEETNQLEILFFGVEQESGEASLSAVLKISEVFAESNNVQKWFPLVRTPSKKLAASKKRASLSSIPSDLEEMTDTEEGFQLLVSLKRLHTRVESEDNVSEVPSRDPALRSNMSFDSLDSPCASDAMQQVSVPEIEVQQDNRSRTGSILQKNHPLPESHSSTNLANESVQAEILSEFPHLHPLARSKSFDETDEESDRLSVSSFGSVSSMDSNISATSSHYRTRSNSDLIRLGARMSSSSPTQGSETPDYKFIDLLLVNSWELVRSRRWVSPDGRVYPRLQIRARKSRQHRHRRSHHKHRHHHHDSDRDHDSRHQSHARNRHSSGNGNGVESYDENSSYAESDFHSGLSDDCHSSDHDGSYASPVDYDYPSRAFSENIIFSPGGHMSNSNNTGGKSSSVDRDVIPVESRKNHNRHRQHHHHGHRHNRHHERHDRGQGRQHQSGEDSSPDDRNAIYHSGNSQSDGDSDLLNGSFPSAPILEITGPCPSGSLGQENLFSLEDSNRLAYLSPPLPDVAVDEESAIVEGMVEALSDQERYVQRDEDDDSTEKVLARSNTSGEIILDDIDITVNNLSTIPSISLPKIHRSISLPEESSRHSDETPRSLTERVQREVNELEDMYETFEQDIPDGDREIIDSDRLFKGITIELPFSAGVLHSHTIIPTDAIGRYPWWLLVIRYRGDGRPDHRIRGRFRIDTDNEEDTGMRTEAHIDTLRIDRNGHFAEIAIPGNVSWLSVTVDVHYEGNVQWRSQEFDRKSYRGSVIHLEEIYLRGCHSVPSSLKRAGCCLIL